MVARNPLQPHSRWVASLLAGLLFVAAGPRPCGAVFNFDSSFDRVLSVNAASWLMETDVDGDGRTDLVVIGTANLLVVHRGLAGGLLAPAATLLTFPAVLRSAKVGDLNADGHPDFVVVDSDNNAYSVLNNGDGTFQPARWVLSLFAGQVIALADLDGDGRQDLVAVASWGPIILMKGKGDGSFLVAGTIATPGAIEQIALADFDGDSRPDLLAVYDSYGGDGDIHAALFYHGLPGMTFGTPVTCMPNVAGVVSIRVADLDNDGFQDAMVAGPSTAVSLLYGSAQGPTTRRLDIAVSGAVDVCARDFDGDGALDLAMTARSSTEDGLVFFQHQASGGYLRVADCTGGTSPAGFAFLDVNADDIPDVLAANPGFSSLVVVKGHGGFKFGGELEIPIVGRPEDLTSGDLDLDGRPDVVLSLVGTQSRSVSLFGNGDWTFRAPVYSSMSTFERIVLGDVNGDGKSDLVGTGWFANAVQSLLGDGTGQFTFASKVSFPFPWYPSNHFDLAAADFNEDGKDDVVLATDGGLVLCAGSSSGVLGAPVAIAGQQKCVVTADLNRDGHVDVIATNSMLDGDWGSNVSVFLGGGDGTFTALPTFYSGYKPALLVARDLTRDGIPDLVVYNTGEGTIMTYRGIGDGTFALASTLTGISTRAMDVADCDGDENPDLVLGAGSSSAVAIRPGYGNGMFGAPETFGCRTPDVVRCVDLNGDLFPEIVVGHFTRPLFTVLRNRGNGLATPVLMGGVEAKVDGRHVEVTWFCDATALASATVQRGVGLEWQDVGRAAVQGPGSLVFKDDVAPGEYDYRLRLDTGGQQMLLGLVHVVVIAPDRLAIESCAWDPSASAFRVKLSIPGTIPADVTAFDVAGRSVATLRAVPAAAESQEVRLQCGFTPPPGIYWVQARQAGQVVRARSVLFR